MRMIQSSVQKAFKLVPDLAGAILAARDAMDSYATRKTRAGR